ncbi:hypothetical protein [Geodermatophilus chilensis]|uniref:hypothetical protein n=1 Tax=Geodermatophilus chilensis TaxID=2035835 RepID=UPI000C26043C|nr:hypothetical protein [Geodermatophilus chilensis]
MSLEPVRCGTAEQLARLWYLRAIHAGDHDVVMTVDDLVSFLLGDAGDVTARQRLWAQLDADCHLLWSLMDGLWQPDDLDELTDRDWVRMSFSTVGHEIQARYERTRERVAADIEGAVRLARYSAAEARRAARTAVA